MAMAARIGLLLALIHILAGVALGARTQLDYGHARAIEHHPPTSCEESLLFSLSTFTTSGTGYFNAPADSEVGSVLQLRSSNHSSSGSALLGGWTFEPTPPHKPLWPLSHRDVLLLTLAAVTLFVAAGGGIGGGAVFVPLYIFVGGFTAPQAVALSNITIMGGAVANFLANSTKRHAFRDRSLVDWDLIMVMEPTTMLGALLGSYTNKLFPVWFTSCLMAALLTFLTYKLLLRGVSTFLKESKDHAHERQQRRRHHLQQQQQQQHQDDNNLHAPLLPEVHFASESNDVSIAAAAATAGDGVHGHVKHQDQTADSSPGSAWMDAATPEDQRQHHHSHSRHYSSTGLADAAPAGDAAAAAAAAAAADDAFVVPVPHGLKPIVVQHHSNQHQQQQQHLSPVAAAARVETPTSAGAFSVEPSPRPAVDALKAQLVSPLVWSNPSTATAAEAAPYIGPFGRPDKQQRRQDGLLLHASAVGRGSSSSGKGLKQRICCRCCAALACCRCWDPATLKLSTIEAYETQQLPWQPLLTLFVLSCWVVASDTGKATLPCGSLHYWAVVLSVIPPCVLVTLVVRQWLLAKTAVQTAAVAAAAALSGAPATEAAAATSAAEQQKAGIIHWTRHNSISYPLVCSLAGVFAGLFGVGGGIVKGPLMLELGVLPEVAAATSATMIMFTAGSAAVVYLNFGGVVKDYAQALLLLGFLVTLAGQLVATHLVRVLKRRSIIIFAMGLLMLLASLAAVYQMGLSTYTAYEHPPMWVWGSICQRR